MQLSLVFPHSHNIRVPIGAGILSRMEELGRKVKRFEFEFHGRITTQISLVGRWIRLVKPGLSFELQFESRCETVNYFYFSNSGVEKEEGNCKKVKVELLKTSEFHELLSVLRF